MFVNRRSTVVALADFVLTVYVTIGIGSERYI
jgi:hypothetical protein